MIRKVKPFTRFALSLLVISSLSAHSQQLTDLSAIQRGDSIEVAYNLNGQSGRAYTIALLASHDNYKAPLKFVAGDVGDSRVLPGPGKVIIWRVKQELTNFFGDIAFEIRAVPAPPLFSEVTTSTVKVKRGSDVTILWKGGRPNQKVNVELIKGDKITQAGIVPNSGQFVYTVPAKHKTGKYKIRLMQGGEEVSGAPLTITGKIPMAAKLAVMPVVGVAVYFIFFHNPPEPFPEPPDLTSN